MEIARAKQRAVKLHQPLGRLQGLFVLFAARRRSSLISFQQLMRWASSFWLRRLWAQAKTGLWMLGSTSAASRDRD